MKPILACVLMAASCLSLAGIGAAQTTQTKPASAPASFPADKEWTVPDEYELGPKTTLRAAGDVLFIKVGISYELPSPSSGGGGYLTYVKLDTKTGACTPVVFLLPDIREDSFVMAIASVAVAPDAKHAVIVV